MENENFIEITAERIARQRKRTIAYNIALVLFFCILIIGTERAVHYFNLSENLNAQLEKAKIEAIHRADSIELLKLQIQKDKIIQDNLLLEVDKKYGAKGLPGVQAAINNITSSRDSARSYSEAGYRYLKNRKFPEALEAFHRSEQWYNGYRESYEIYFLLWKNKANLNDPALQTQLLKKIQNDLDSKGFLKGFEIK